MTEFKTKYKRAYKRLEDFNIIQENVRSTIAKTLLNTSINPTQRTLSVREVAKLGHLKAL